MVKLLVRQALEDTLDDDADERLRVERRARDEIVEEAADDMAQLIVLLQQLKAAVVLFLDDGGQTAAQERQMLFNGIHLARCIGVEVLAHVRCCPAHDLLD